MATDARISTAFPSHPKTKKLRRRLGDSGPLGCMYLFLWAAANRSDGDLSGLSDEDIELAVDWEGDHGALVAEMVEVGFLDGDEGSRRIHDWAEHNPWAAGADARSEKARWAALCKQHGRREAARMMPEYAERLLDASHESATSTKNSATSKLGAVLDGAKRMPLADSSSAPSPSPSPSPEEQEPNGSLSAKADTTNCPHSEIIALYHEILPANPRIKVWDGARADHLRARWREDPKRQSLDYWRRYFAHVAASPFLTGKVEGQGGRPFLPGLDWLVRASNFAKVIEGRYHDRVAS